MHVVRIASVNNNGICNETWVGMLRDFIQSNDLDVILVQEVTAPENMDTQGYKSYTNTGSEMRGAPILARQDLHIAHRHSTIRPSDSSGVHWYKNNKCVCSNRHGEAYRTGTLL
jgi:exonuclease III